MLAVETVGQFTLSALYILIVFVSLPEKKKHRELSCGVETTAILL